MPLVQAQDRIIQVSLFFATILLTVGGVTSFAHLPHATNIFVWCAPSAQSHIASRVHMRIFAEEGKIYRAVQPVSCLRQAADSKHTVCLLPAGTCRGIASNLILFSYYASPLSTIAKVRVHT